MNKLATLLVAGAVAFSPLSSMAADESPAHAPKVEHKVEKAHKPVGHKSAAKSTPSKKNDTDLQATQNRLNQLIKAATKKEAAPKGESDGPSWRTVEKYAPRDAHGRCVAQEIFDFPSYVRVSDYVALTEIKNAIVTGPDQLDHHQVRLLTLTYMGLGFGEEAQHFSSYLKGREKRVLDAMGRAVGGFVRERDIAMLDVQGGCYENAALWAQFARAQLADKALQRANAMSIEEASHQADTQKADTDAKKTHEADAHETNAHKSDTQVVNEHIVVHGQKRAHVKKVKHSDDISNEKPLPVDLTEEQFLQIEALPRNLGAIMMQRFGLDAIKNEDVETYERLMRMIKKAQKKAGHEIAFDDEGKYFEALYMLETGDRHAFPILNKLGQRDGAMQVRALQTLGTAQLKTGHKTYSGYEKDLDAAAMVFSAQPEGQQALAEKIGFFVSTGALGQAIGMTKEKFTPADQHYVDSVVLVSARMEAQFLGHDNVKKVQALNTLLREHVFFDALVDSFPLRSAGVSASLDVGLAELAPRVLSTDQWHRLDLHVLQELAVALPDEMKADLPEKAFSGPAMEVLEIRTAFQAQNPQQAMAALRKLPDNAVATQVAADEAWEAGYWGLARDAIGDLPQADTAEQAQGRKVKKALASVLSVPSPHLTPPKASQTIGDLETLQTFLDKDIEIIKEYVNGG